MRRRRPFVGVVGHVEWVTHALGRPPEAGDIVDLHEPREEPAGGGAVAAAAACRLGADVALFTALGGDDRAARSEGILTSRGIEVLAARRDGGQTPVLSIADPRGERTIMVVGNRMQPQGADPLPWRRLAGVGAAYYAGEDPASLQYARSAPALVVTARRLADVTAAGVRPDVVVASAADNDEDPWGLPPRLAPGVIVVTNGARGGVIHRPGEPDVPFSARAPDGLVVDSYGCGDSFAAGLAVGLAGGLGIGDAVGLGARAGADCATRRGGLGPAP